MAIGRADVIATMLYVTVAAMSMCSGQTALHRITFKTWPHAYRAGPYPYRAIYAQGRAISI